MSCHICQKRPETGILACSQCMRAHYCGPSCQKKAWPEHKASCIGIQGPKKEATKGFRTPPPPKKVGNKQKVLNTPAWKEYEAALLKWSEEVESATKLVDQAWEEAMNQYNVSEVSQEAFRLRAEQLQDTYERSMNILLPDEEREDITKLISGAQDLHTIIFTGTPALNLQEIVLQEKREEQRVMVEGLLDAILGLVDEVMESRIGQEDVDFYEDEEEVERLLSAEGPERVGMSFEFLTGNLQRMRKVVVDCFSNERWERLKKDQWNKNRAARRTQQVRLATVLLNDMMVEADRERAKERRDPVLHFIDQLLERLNKYQRPNENGFVGYFALKICLEKSLDDAADFLNREEKAEFLDAYMLNFASFRDRDALISYKDATTVLTSTIQDQMIDADTFNFSDDFEQRLLQYLVPTISNFLNLPKWFSGLYYALGFYVSVKMSTKLFYAGQEHYEGLAESIRSLNRRDQENLPVLRNLVEQVKEDIAVVREASSAIAERRGEMVSTVDQLDVRALYEEHGLEGAKSYMVELCRAWYASIKEAHEVISPSPPDVLGIEPYVLRGGEVTLFRTPKLPDDTDTITLNLFSVAQQAELVRNAKTPEDYFRQANGIKAGLVGTANVVVGQKSRQETERIAIYNTKLIENASTHLVGAMTKIAKTMEELEGNKGELVETITKLQKEGRARSNYDRMLEYISNITTSQTWTSLFHGSIGSALDGAERTFSKLRSDPMWNTTVTLLGSRAIGAAGSIAALLGKYAGALFLAFLQLQMILKLGQYTGYALAIMGKSLQKIGELLNRLIFPPNWTGISLTEELQLINKSVKMSRTAKGLWWTSAALRLLGKETEWVGLGMAKGFGMISWWGTLLLAVAYALSFVLSLFQGGLIVILALVPGILAAGVLTVIGTAMVLRVMAWVLHLRSPHFHYPMLIRMRDCFNSVVDLGVKGFTDYQLFDLMQKGIRHLWTNSSFDLENMFGFLARDVQ